MPPRRRAQKRGNTRTDAALDAMRQFGFCPKLVRQTLKTLLKEYGGDDGWVFIEDASYLLLIETILKNQKDSSDDDKLALKGAETAESSCGASEPACTEVEDVKALALKDPETPEPSQGAVKPACTEVENVKTLAPKDAETAEPSCGAIKPACPEAENIKKLAVKEETIEPASHEVEVVNKMADIVYFASFEPIGDTGAQDDMQSPKPEAFLSPRKRRPYHGWICDDEDHDPDDLLDLVREQLSVSWNRLLRRRIPRWDVRVRDL